MITVEEALGEVETPEPEVVVEDKTGTTEETAVVEKTAAAEETTETEKTEKTDSLPESETSKDTKTIPISAFHGVERAKDKLQRDFDAYQVAHPETPVEKTSVLVDEDKAFEERGQETQTYVKNVLLEAGKSEAVLQYDQVTVDTAEKWFLEQVEERPLLLEELRGVSPMQQHRKVVLLHKDQLKRDALQENPEQYEDDLKAKGVKEYLEKQKAEADKDKAVIDDKKAVVDSIPKSLVGDPSDGALTGSDWSGPTPIGSVLSEGG